MTKEEIVQKFIDASKAPTRYTIPEVLGFSAKTLAKRGVSVREIKDLFKRRTKVGRLCLSCNVPLSGYQEKFCSSSCSAKNNNKSRLRRTASVGDGKTCLMCLKVLSNKRSVYCSASCHQEHKYKVFIESWLSGDGIELSTGSGAVPSKVRRYFLDKFSSKCSMCGWGEINPITGKTPLEIDHIDGNSSNNSVGNLRLLCPNCHSLTPTYKALNKGKGRHNRRQRRAEGKSH